MSYPTNGQDHLHGTMHIIMTCKNVTCSWATTAEGILSGRYEKQARIKSICKHILTNTGRCSFADFSLTSYEFILISSLCSYKLCVILQAFSSKRNFMRLRVKLRARHNDLFMFTSYLLSNWAQLVGV